MTIKIYGDDKIYIETIFPSQILASNFQRLLNEDVGGFECKDPKESEGKWQVLSLCQLHTKDDNDATPGDRGNTIADCFIRIIHIAASYFPTAKISKVEVIGTLKNLVEFLPFASENPQYHKLDKLLEVVESSADDVQTLNSIFQKRTHEFVLSEDEQANLSEGAYLPLPKALKRDYKKSLNFKPHFPEYPMVDINDGQNHKTNRCSDLLGAAGMLGLAIVVIGIYLAWRG